MLLSNVIKLMRAVSLNKYLLSELKNIRVVVVVVVIITAEFYTQTFREAMSGIT